VILFSSLAAEAAITPPLAMIFFDPRYFIVVGPAILLAIFAQVRVQSTVARWSRVPLASGRRGVDVAEAVLRYGGVDGVRIERVAGRLTDHYDPRSRVLRLSEGNYSGSSVAAAAIAAHEAGHAIQHARDYAPLHMRGAAVPLANFGSGFGVLLLIGGILFAMQPLLLAGIVLFSFVVFFQLITLPVEFDASRRAKIALREGGFLRDDEEGRGVSAVLGAAALTYVAAAVQSIMTLLYYVMIFTGRRD
jgi:Zn-dependent membrane protease YugP